MIECCSECGRPKAFECSGCGVPTTNLNRKCRKCHADYVRGRRIIAKQQQAQMVDELKRLRALQPTEATR